MPRRRLSKAIDELSPEERNPETWPNVDEAALAPEERDLYRRRKQAVVAYLRDVPAREIARDTGIPPDEVSRLTKRCLNRHPDQLVQGFRALIPRVRLKAYRQHRTLESPIHPGPGAFSELLERFPSVKAVIDQHCDKAARITGLPGRRMPTDAIHREFLKACRAAGIREDEYPLVLRTQARESLRKYLHRRSDQRAARRHESSADSPNLHDGGKPPAILRNHRRPLAVCQLDAHRIDTHSSVLVAGPWMVPVRVPLPRMWLLVVADTASHAALGYSLSLSTEYTKDDVLKALKHSIVPWTPRELTLPGFHYRPGAGFPSGVIPEYRAAIFDALQMDNARQHRSHAVHHAAVEQLHALLHLGPAKMPEVRNDIERLFKTFASDIHRLPPTTGSGPDDPRRDTKSNAALTHGVDLTHIEDLVEIILANYNSWPNHATGQAPLDYMRHFADRLGPTIRRVPEHEIHNFRLNYVWESGHIRARDGKKGRPYVHYAYVAYTNPYLKAIPSSIGHKVNLGIDPDDLRFIDLYWARTGAYITTLQAEGGWGLTRHSLRTRKFIVSACRKGQFKFGPHDDPVQKYLEYINDYTIRTGKGANRAVEISRTARPPSQHKAHATETSGFKSEAEAAATGSTEHRGNADATAQKGTRRPWTLRPWVSITKK